MEEGGGKIDRVGWCRDGENQYMLELRGEEGKR